MRKLLVLVALGVTLTGCANPDYDPDLCDIYQSIGAMAEENQGYTPADTQAMIDRYCER